MPKDDLLIRRASVADAARIADVHVACWLETYRGIVPQDMLARLSVQRRAAAWETILSDPDKHFRSVAFLACEGESVVAFGACSDQRDSNLKNLGFDGEIGSIYVLRHYQKRGYGRSIMRALAGDLRTRRHRGVALWVLRDNFLARSFYEQCGGKLVGEKDDVRGDVVLTEVAYGWHDLTMLQ